jgi:hypothetical protein
MPIHDWARVPDGTWHAFHVSWISAIQEALNGGLLPTGYYAQAEQIAGPLGPDVLALEEEGHSEHRNGGISEGGGVATARPKPRLRASAEAEMASYVLKRRTVVIRHVSGDRVVALLEIVSPWNKAARHHFRSFVEKAAEALFRGYHLSVIDLFPPTPRDPRGIHAAIWGEIAGDDDFTPPPGEPLTLVAYSGGLVKRAYIEPAAVGKELIELPVFLTEDDWVGVPLEATYQAAYRGVPRRWKDVLEAPSPGS